MKREDVEGSAANHSPLATEDGDHVFHRNDEEPVVTFEINRDPMLWIEEHAIILSDRVILIAIDLGTDRHHSSSQGWNLDLVRKMNTDLGDLAILVLANEDAVTNRFDGLDSGRFVAFSGHDGILPPPTPWGRMPRITAGGSIGGMNDVLEPLIRDIPDFPKPGILFKDITPLLADPAGLSLAVELMANPFRNQDVDLVVGAESRGFIFGTAVAQSLSCGFVPVRKPGKLPAEVHSVDYGLEYGTDTLQVHVDAIKQNQRVLVVDDLLATGGTMKACLDLIRGLGAEVAGASVLIELTGMGGTDKLGGTTVNSILKY